jgi:type III secretion system FlhB-like substrate exporter
MPNKQTLTEYRFRPELIAAMRAAFLKACEAPQVTGHGTTEIVAEKILELAKAGETNSDRLCTGALRRLSQ